MITRAVVLIFISSVLAAGCSSTQKYDDSTAQGAFRLAQQYEKDGRYREAISKYSKVKNKHSYSKYAVKAKLRLADVHYKRQNYAKAQGAYQVFKELHPKHPKIDYVTFRLGMSYFKQLPDTIDRDLSKADKAILHFKEVINSYPNSSYHSKAKKYHKKALKMLREKELYIAHFYFIRDFFQTALGRYKDVLQKDSNLGYKARALYGAAVSSYHVEDKGAAQKYYDLLMTEHSQTKWAEKAKGKLADEL